ncbi:BZ3501_MvSof-1269-A2-R1_Chr7-2g09351 [Microbotryum saponariae]|nr:BZ3501_MvSof-1269-A2-R1_Chr7-2g09351 [Microbotryum saponariae]
MHLLSSDWEHIAAHAASILKDLPAVHGTAAKCTKPSQSIRQRWDQLHLRISNHSAFQNGMDLLHCSSDVQKELAHLYTSSLEDIRVSCIEAFESTMRNLSAAVHDHELDIFRRSEEAVRKRFTDLFTFESETMRVKLLEEIDRARQQVVSSDARAPASPSSREAKSTSINDGVNQMNGTFDAVVNKILLSAFTQFEHLTKGERLALAKRTGLSQKQVATWFANQRQRRSRQETGPIEDQISQPSLKELDADYASRSSQPVAPPLFVLTDHTKGSTVDMPESRQRVPAVPFPTTSPIVQPLTDFGPIFNRTPIASHDSDVSSLSYQIDSSDFSVDSLDSNWSQDAPDSYYGLPLPPASDMQFSFELPPTEAIEHFDYSPDNSIWNAFDSSFSSSSSSADSYLDDYTFQPPMSAEVATPLTCGLLTARQATFAESPSSFGSPPLSTPDVEMDMDADSVFGHISEFGVLTASSNTGLASASPN